MIKFCLKIAIDLTVLILVFSAINNSYKYDQLDEKIPLLKEDPILYFAGDSRALWQLRPDVASEHLGVANGKVVNIARIAGHPVEIENFIKKNVDRFKNATIVISVSAFLFNGAAKTPHHFSKDLIAGENVFEQIRIFMPDNLLTLQNYYNYIVLRFFRKTTNETKFDNYGYSPLSHKISYDLLNHERLSGDPWYKDFYIDSRKVKEIEKSLLNIKKMCKNIVVYNGPFAKTFHDTFKSYRIYDIEREFDAEVNQMCARHNIKYISYFMEYKLSDNYFADWAHLNDAGSKIFTIRILDDIGLSRL